MSTAVTTSTPREPVLGWIDEDAGQLMSELGPVDNACFARVLSRHCPVRGPAGRRLIASPRPRLPIAAAAP